jgi:hypothetical protein
MARKKRFVTPWRRYWSLRDCMGNVMVVALGVPLIILLDVGPKREFGDYFMPKPPPRL